MLQVLFMTEEFREAVLRFVSVLLTPLPLSLQAYTHLSLTGCLLHYYSYRNLLLLLSFIDTDKADSNILLF